MEKKMNRELTPDEKLWCLEQAIAVIKEVGHGSAAYMRDAAGALQGMYQSICALRRDTLGNT
jgi:hypothetical protein